MLLEVLGHLQPDEGLLSPAIYLHRGGWFLLQAVPHGAGGVSQQGRGESGSCHWRLLDDFRVGAVDPAGWALLRHSQ